MEIWWERYVCTKHEGTYVFVYISYHQSVWHMTPTNWWLQLFARSTLHAGSVRSLKEAKDKTMCCSSLRICRQKKASNLTSLPPPPLFPILTYIKCPHQPQPSSSSSSLPKPMASRIRNIRVAHTHRTHNHFADTSPQLTTTYECLKWNLLFFRFNLQKKNRFSCPCMILSTNAVWALHVVSPSYARLLERE